MRRSVPSPLLASGLVLLAVSTACGGASEGGASQGQGGGGAAPSDVECERLFVEGVDSGLELCGSQYLRRREAVTCAERGTASEAQCVPGDPDEPCNCATDDDCGEGYLCQCWPYQGQCVPATCRSPVDCGGGECRDWTTGCKRAFACASESDVCTLSEDCGDDGTCTLGEDGVPACLPSCDD